MFGLGRASPQAALRAFERSIERVNSLEARSELASALIHAERVVEAIQNKDKEGAEFALHALGWHISDKLTPMRSSYSRLSASLRQAVRDLA